MTRIYANANTVLPFIIGILAFFLVAGPKVLNPTNIAWLDQGDPATHYLGWLFFRNAEWSFPLGMNPNYGLELANAILFSDSLPLFAFLFKPFSALLPETFQYFGIWLLVCFVMQAWFGWKLMGLVSEGLVVRTLGAAFFVFAPPMIWRLHGHLSLVGHFLILGALYLTLHKRLQRRKFAWGTLLTVAALVHAYLLAMTGLLWLTDLIARTIRKNLLWRKAITEFAALLLVVGVTCWQAGYFSVGDGLIAWGYGFYRMNLLSLVDPSGWSYILKDIPEAAGDYEGFNYLGLGAITLLIFSLPVLISRRTNIMQAIRRYPVLLITCLGLTIFALSNKVGFGLHGFEYPLPELVLEMANVFRASGRMFWPVFYLILFSAIFLLVRGYEKRTASILLGLALVIQIVDTSAVYKGIPYNKMAEPSTAWNTSLTSPFWGEGASKYSKVRWVPPGNISPHWQTLAAYAGSHGLSTDAVYLARISTLALQTATEQASKAIASGSYEPDSLYILDDAVLLRAAININTEYDLLARVDGFNVIAPGGKRCESLLRLAEEVEINELLPPIKVGERILFNNTGSGQTYLVHGWSHPEPWGVWSEGEKATILLPLPGADIASILFEAHPLLSPSHLKQNVEVRINGIGAAELLLTSDSDKLLEVKIPETTNLKEGNNTIKLEFYLPDAARPIDIGINNDTRQLALGLIALTVR